MGIAGDNKSSRFKARITVLLACAWLLPAGAAVAASANAPVRATGNATVPVSLSVGNYVALNAADPFVVPSGSQRVQITTELVTWTASGRSDIQQDAGGAGLPIGQGWEPAGDAVQSGPAGGGMLSGAEVLVSVAAL